MGHRQEPFRIFCCDQSELKVPLRSDEPNGRYFLDCPDLEENPIHTKSGYLWVNVVQDSCPYHEDRLLGSSAYHDCGSCRFFESEQPEDILGICRCPRCQRKTEPNEKIP